MGIICNKTGNALGRDYLGHIFNKSGLEEPVFSMPALGPWIGKIYINFFNRSWKYVMTCKGLGFSTNDKQVRNSLIAHLRPDLPDTIKSFFDSYPIAIGIGQRLTDDPVPVSAAIFHRNRMVVSKNGWIIPRELCPLLVPVVKRRDKEDPLMQKRTPALPSNRTFEIFGFHMPKESNPTPNSLQNSRCLSKVIFIQKYFLESRS